MEEVIKTPRIIEIPEERHILKAQSIKLFGMDVPEDFLEFNNISSIFSEGNRTCNSEDVDRTRYDFFVQKEMAALK